MPTVSVTTAAALAGVDRKTIRRWLGEGAIDLGALLEHAGSRPPEAVILAADSGDPDACAELGTFFLEAGMHARAVDWLQRAADRNHADGMHWLARAYLDGRGVERDLNLGLMWLGRSASLGHAIAAAQVRALFSGR